MIRSAAFDCTLVFEKPLRGYFPEAVMRGGLGYSLRRLVCINPRAVCATCLVRGNCLFAVMYPPPSGSGAPTVAPYALHALVGADACTLTLGITLFGPMLPMARLLAFSLIRLGSEGVGKERIRFAVQSVRNRADGRELYDGRDRLDEPSVRDLRVSLAADTGETFCRVYVTGPLMLVRDGVPIQNIGFTDLVRAIYLRARNLERAFGDSADDDLPEALRLSNAVAAEQYELRWMRRERYSTRQRSVHAAGGLTGTVAFRGALGRFSTLLNIGAWTGIGKHTTFGCGRYHLAWE